MLECVLMKLNTEKYLPLVDGLDLSLEQKIEVISCIWGIIESCVDAEFGVHPVQNTCGITQKNTSGITKPTIDSKRSNFKKLFNGAGDSSV